MVSVNSCFLFMFVFVFCVSCLRGGGSWVGFVLVKEGSRYGGSARRVWLQRREGGVLGLFGWDLGTWEGRVLVFGRENYKSIGYPLASFVLCSCGFGLVWLLGSLALRFWKGWNWSFCIVRRLAR